ncbi:MAG: hypothetical protein EOO65_05605 [Methanosarcinales archaeon]|nr:MAG: hypothetical protein EOO65_05605 [Methanosarcinales archaeon]
MFAIYNYATSCTRRYYMKWYENYSKAAGRLPEPHWTGPLVPMYDAKHDEFVIKKRAEDKM